MLPQYIVFGQLGLIVVVEVFTLLLAWSYFKLHRQNLELQKKVAELDHLLLADEQKILDKARDEGKQLIVKAQGQAEKIVGDAQEFGSQSNQALAKMLDSLSEKQVEVSNQVIGRVRDDTVTLLQELIQNLKQHAASEMDTFGKGLQQEFTTARQNAQQTIDAAYGTATAEVEAYKEKRLEQIKRQMTILVREIVEKVLAKSVDERQHEQLVLQAVEEAKKDGIL